VVILTPPATLHPPDGTSVTHWTGAGQDVPENRKISCPARIRTPDRPAPSLVIYSQVQLPLLF